MITLLLASAALLSRAPVQYGVDAPVPPRDGGFGASVCFVPDCDGDRIADYLVGAPCERWGDDPEQEGVVRLFSGRTGLLLRKETGVYGLGEDVCCVGDCDGDGIADYAAGSRSVISIRSGRTGAELCSIAARRLLGMRSASGIDHDGLADVAALIDVADLPNEELDMVSCFSARSGNRILRIGPWEGRERIVSFAFGGSLDADRVPDLLVASRVDLGASSIGRVRSFSGATNAVLTCFSNSEDDAWFGGSLAFVGDLDEDGRDEWVAMSSSLFTGGKPQATPPQAASEESGENVAIGTPSPNQNSTRAPLLACVYSGRYGSRILELRATVPGFAGVIEGAAGTDDLDGDGVREILLFTKAYEWYSDAPVLCFSGRAGTLVRRLENIRPAGLLVGDLGFSWDCGSDLDGDGGPEVLLGDVHTDFGGPAHEGVVHVFSVRSGRYLRTTYPLDR